MGDRPEGAAYRAAFGSKAPLTYESFLLSYRSDGLRLYTRVDVPAGPPPAGGYPVVVFAHGWVGIDSAPTFHFSFTPKSMYAEWIDAFAQAGYVVLTPGYRGHGASGGAPADGLSDMADWDNATYVSPALYAIDVLNLLEGLPNLRAADWARQKTTAPRLDLMRVNLFGHSQGGDVALMVLAATGKGSRARVRIRNAAILSGTFPDRLTQLETYEAMQSSREAVLAGDGSWNGTAVGAGGKVNANFVFGWPGDWVQANDPRQDDFAASGWGKEAFAIVQRRQAQKLYERLDRQVGDMKGLSFEARQAPGERFQIVHDPRVVATMGKIGAFGRAELIDAGLSLHFPDRDFYALPAWNRDLCARMIAAGGTCATHEYAGNTHGFRLSASPWFSPPGSIEAYGLAAQRMLAQFAGTGPSPAN